MSGCECGLHPPSPRLIAPPEPQALADLYCPLRPPPASCRLSVSTSPSPPWPYHHDNPSRCKYNTLCESFCFCYKMYVAPQPPRAVLPLQQLESLPYNVTSLLPPPPPALYPHRPGQHLVSKENLLDIWAKRSWMVWGWGVFSCALSEDKGLDFCLFGRREI